MDPGGVTLVEVETVGWLLAENHIGSLWGSKDILEVVVVVAPADVVVVIGGVIVVPPVPTDLYILSVYSKV